MLFHWFRLSDQGNKNRLRHRSGRLRLEHLEDRCCPSNSTYAIGTDTIIPAAGAAPFIKGEHVQFNITVSSTEPNEASEDEIEAAAVTSSVTGGFHAQVNVFSTQTFDYVIKKNGETFKIATSDNDETGTVSVMVNSPGLKFVEQPSIVLAGAAMAPVVVQVVDVQGRPLGDFNGDVTLTLGNSFTAGSMLDDGNPITVQAQGGIATFSNLSINRPGNNYSLVASLDDGTQTSSSYFTIGEKLVFTQQPSDGLPGKAITPTVRVAVENADGSPDTAYSGDITLSFANDTTGGIAKLSGNTATVQNGVASFPNLVIDTSGVGYALEATTSDATASNGSQVASDDFDIAHYLNYIQQPTAVGVSQTMTPAPEVAVYGPDGITVDTSFNGTVTLKFSTDVSGGKATLTGNVATAQNGIAIFPSLQIDQPGTGYTVVASIADDAQIISTSFNVGLNLVFSKPPTSGVPGKPLAPAVTVLVEEPNGAPDTAYSGDITLSFANDPTGGVAKLSGNTAIVLNGKAVFPNLAIDTTGLKYTLTASAVDGDAGPTTSASFDVAHVLGFTQKPLETAVGNLLKPVTVEVFRANGVTLDTSYSGPVTLAISHDASAQSNAHLLGLVTVLASKGVATFSTLSLDQPGSNYTLIATVPDTAQKTSSAFTIDANSSTKATFKILASPVNQTTCVGDTATFTVAAAGFPVPTVKWQVSTDSGMNFSDITGATSDILTVPATQSGQNGDEYRAVFNNTVDTTAVTLTVNIPPQIATGGDPQGTTAVVGQKATFTAMEAGGSPAPKVQWQVSTDGGLSYSNLVAGVTVATTVSTGGETSTLSFIATAGQGGFLYRAVFANHCSVTTSAATLTVQNAKPIIIGQPVSQSATAGQSVTFTAAATGNQTPTVKWLVSTNGGQKFLPDTTDVVNSSDNANGITTTLTLSPALAQSGTEYEVVFTNSAGQVTSKAATLTVVAQPAITVSGNPQSQTVTAGQKVTFTASATGKPTPQMQWQTIGAGGVSLFGFTTGTPGTTTTKVVGGVETATLSFIAQRGQDGEKFVAVFFNSTGFAFTTPPAGLTVLYAPQVSVQPKNQGSSAGGQATFTASAIGDPAPTSVQWQVSTDKGMHWQPVTGTSTPIANGLAATLTLTDIQADQNGAEYEAVFTAGSATVTTRAATLTLGTLPQVTSSGNPQSQTVAAGQKNVTFTAKATTGSPAATVQWQASSDGGLTFTPFTAGTVVTSTAAGVETTTLTLTAQAQQDGELFRAMFSNLSGSVPTSAAALTVTSPPVVVDQPINQTVTNGQTATFAVLAAGDPKPEVQWQIFNSVSNSFEAVSGSSTSDAFTGATADIFTLTTTPADKGKKILIRAAFTNTIGTTVSTVFSNVVTLTVE